MPEYTFECPDCNAIFVYFMRMAEYDAAQTCDQCGGDLKRNYQADLPRGNVKLNPTDIHCPMTIGELAQMNTETISADERRAIYEKNNAYKGHGEGEDTRGKHKRVLKRHYDPNLTSEHAKANPPRQSYPGETRRKIQKKKRTQKKKDK